jgi:hypothetical protein
MQEIKTRTEITRNSLEIQKLRLEIQKLEREEQIAKEKAYREWLASPAGQAAMKRERDKHEREVNRISLQSPVCAYL